MSKKVKISAKAVGKTLIVVIDGKIYNRVFDTHENLQEVLNVIMQGPTQKEIDGIYDAMAIKKSEAEAQAGKERENKIEENRVQIAKEKEFFDALRDIKENGHEVLSVEGSSMYMKGINISIPRTLVEKFINGGYTNDTLINFWRLCALNPDPRARQDLFDFLAGGKFTVTPNGYFVAYRNVSIKQIGTKKTVNDEVNKLYLKVKAMKKAPKNYSLVRIDQELILVTNVTLEKMFKKREIIASQIEGNLDYLYRTQGAAQASETVYTDNYTKTMTIKINELVKMDRTKCDANPENDCSYGLHVGNKKFLSKGSFGKESLAVLVNPSKVIAVPEYNQNKMRVCEYLPIGVVEYDNDGQIVEVEATEIDFDYSEITMEELKDLVTANSDKLEEYKKQELIPQELTVESLSRIVVSLSKINDIVKNRVQRVDND